MDTKQRVSVVAMILASSGLGGLVGISSALSAIHGADLGGMVIGTFGVGVIVLAHIVWDETTPEPAVILMTLVGASIGLAIGYTEAMDQPLPMMGELYFATHWPVLVGIIIMRYMNE